MNRSILLLLLLSQNVYPVLTPSSSEPNKTTVQQEINTEQTNYDLAVKTAKYGGIAIGSLALFYAAVRLYVSYYED